METRPKESEETSSASLSTTSLPPRKSYDRHAKNLAAVFMAETASWARAPVRTAGKEAKEANRKDPSVKNNEKVAKAGTKKPSGLKKRPATNKKDAIPKKKRKTKKVTEEKNEETNNETDEEPEQQQEKISDAEYFANYKGPVNYIFESLKFRYRQVGCMTQEAQKKIPERLAEHREIRVEQEKEKQRLLIELHQITCKVFNDKNKRLEEIKGLKDEIEELKKALADKNTIWLE